MNFHSSSEVVNWFRERYLEGTLKIKPPYQRLPIWTAKQKCYLIESILMGLPIPEVYIQEAISPAGATIYAIVDGQQRVRTILQFMGAETDPNEQEHNKFVLDKLKPTSAWKNVSFEQLSDEDKNRFRLYKLAVRYLNTESDQEVRDMFERLNKYLSPLKAQELRNAVYTGPFITLSTKLADDSYWAENLIVTPTLIRRMGDIEFMSELLIGILHGPQGGSAAIIDEYYKQYEEFDNEFPDQARVARLFSATLRCVQEILPDIKGTRWGNKTDFYTLFVGIALLLRTEQYSSFKTKPIRVALNRLAREVDNRLADEHAEVSNNAIEYVRAVEKGANDKKRRADRQAVLLKVIKPHFVAKKAKR